MVYKVSDLYTIINQLKRQGYKEVEITLNEAEDELPESIMFSVPSKTFSGALEDFAEIEALSETV